MAAPGAPVTAWMRRYAAVGAPVPENQTPLLLVEVQYYLMNTGDLAKTHFVPVFRLQADNPLLLLCCSYSHSRLNYSYQVSHWSPMSHF